LSRRGKKKGSEVLRTFVGFFVLGVFLKKVLNFLVVVETVLVVDVFRDTKTLEEFFALFLEVEVGFFVRCVFVGVGVFSQPFFLLIVEENGYLPENLR